VRLTAADRLAKFTRALIWLVSRSGTSTLGLLSEQFFNGKQNKTVVNLARALVSRGWAECHERSPETGAYIPVFDRVIRVTPAGRVWHDYLIDGVPKMRMTVGDMLTRIKALEKCLAPFAAAGVHCRSSRGPDTQKLNIKVRRGDLEMAADLLHPYHENVVIYPWTPESLRPK
jgi:hypothetical protein